MSYTLTVGMWLFMSTLTAMQSNVTQNNTNKSLTTAINKFAPDDPLSN